MVLQADKPIKVFGEGTGYASVKFMGGTYNTYSEHGEWCITMPPCGCGGPYSMEVELNGVITQLTDIMIGEVWLAAGQSNMELPLYKSLGGTEAARGCRNDNIRFFTVPRRREKDTPEYGDHFGLTPAESLPWQCCDEESAIFFSAIGFYTAQALQEKLGIAVGIISCNWGGSMIEAHIKREYFYESDRLRPIVEEYEAQVGDPEVRLAEWRKYISELNTALLKSFEGVDMLRLVQENGVRSEVERALLKPLEIEHIADGPYKWQAPGLLFEGMYSQIIPYGIRGVLWYQGESNRWRDYLEKYLLLMKCLRTEFQNPDMPFYAFELAGFNNWAVEEECQPHDHRFVTEAVPCNWAYNREQQQRATEVGENNYLVTTMELGDIYDIHPIYKREAAQRLVRKLLKHTYGFDIEADQPTYKSAVFEKHKVIIELNNAEGLHCRNLSLVKLFAADETHELKRAEAEIDGSRLILHCPEVENPILVRYGFDFYYDGVHIYNRAGLPLAPFRTDSIKY